MADHEKTQIFDGSSFAPKKNKPEPPENNLQNNQYSPEPPTTEKKKAGTGILYGVAGAVAGAGILYASQAFATDEIPVEAEIVDTDTLAGMDSVKIGGQNGVVNAILVDTNKDGIMDGQLNLDPMGNNVSAEAHHQDSAVVTGHVFANEKNNMILSGDQEGHVNAILLDADGDGIIDSKLELLPISTVIEQPAVVPPHVPVTPAPVHVPEQVGMLKVADDVNDDMSFAEAFAAARSDVGAGGLFYWHGQSYGTYYENEWANLTEDQKDVYWGSVSVTVEGHETPYDPVIDPSPDITIALNDPDVNDTDDFGPDFNNNANMNEWS